MLVTIPGNGSKPISGLNNDILMALTQLWMWRKEKTDIYCKQNNPVGCVERKKNRHFLETEELIRLHSSLSRDCTNLSFAEGRHIHQVNTF